MKKILVLVTHGFPHGAMNFAIDIARHEKAKVNALFIGDLHRHDYDTYLFPSDINTTDKDYTATTDEEEARHREKDKQKLFTDLCTFHGLSYHMHEVRNNFLDTIIHESAFADLVVCENNMDLDTFSMSNFLSNVHSPVLLVPKNAEKFSSLVFSYDGQPSSIYAMKQFSYLFPWTRSMPAHLVSVLPYNITHMEADPQVREWMELHFSRSEALLMKGDAKTELANVINALSEPLTVMGSYGRSSLSQMFKGSLAAEIVKLTNSPMFICHT